MPQPARPTVFLSHNHRDYELALKVHAFLSKAGTVSFLSEVSLPQLSSCDYMKEIDKALECAKHMIVVGTSFENIMSG